MIFCEETLDRLKTNLREISTKLWDLFYLGGYSGNRQYAISDGCKNLLEVGVNDSPALGPTCTHAIAYHRRSYSRLLDILPETVDLMQIYQPKSQRAIDQILAYDAHLKRFISKPHIASQPPILWQEEPEFRGILDQSS